MNPPVPVRAARLAAALLAAFLPDVVPAKPATADARDAMVTRTLPSGQLDVHYYDALGRKENTTGYADGSQNPATIQYLFTYRYDRSGNLAVSTEAMQGMPSRTLTMGYDDIGRLLTEHDAVSGSPARITTYTYDDAGNRTYKGIDTDGNAIDDEYWVTDVSEDGLNHIESITDHSGAVVTFDYDLEGNRTHRAAGATTRTYDYDRENRLLSVTEGTSQWRYDYDYRTRRVMREENGQTERISFSGGTSVQEYAASSNLSPAVEYIRGSDLGGGIGGILYSVRGGTASFAHYNARGDVVAKSGRTGALTWQARYEGFGSRTAEIGTNPDKQRANTREEEVWGGLYENMRWRDLETGQYFTRDPAGFVDGPNLYAYVRQNPWSKFDPLGLEERTDKDGYKWKEKGHHIVPRESVNEAGWDKSVKDVFDKATVDTPNGHNRTRHGHYSREVSAEMAEFVADRAPNGLTGVSAQDQRELAEEFVRQIQNTDNEFIKGFNSHVSNGPGGVADWFDNKGGKDIIMKSTGLKAGHRFPGSIKIIQGFAKAAKVGGVIVKKSMPVVNGALVLGPALSSGEDANGIARQVIMSASGAADLDSASLWVGESAIKASEHRAGTLTELENWGGDMSAEDMINSFRKRGYR